MSPPSFAGSSSSEQPSSWRYISSSKERSRFASVAPVTGNQTILRDTRSKSRRLATGSPRDPWRGAWSHCLLCGKVRRNGANKSLPAYHSWTLSPWAGGPSSRALSRALHPRLQASGPSDSGALTLLAGAGISGAAGETSMPGHGEHNEEPSCRPERDGQRPAGHVGPDAPTGPQAALRPPGSSAASPGSGSSAPRPLGAALPSHLRERPRQTEGKRWEGAEGEEGQGQARGGREGGPECPPLMGAGREGPGKRFAAQGEAPVPR